MLGNPLNYRAAFNRAVEEEQSEFRRKFLSPSPLSAQGKRKERIKGDAQHQLWHSRRQDFPATRDSRGGSLKTCEKLRIRTGPTINNGGKEARDLCRTRSSVCVCDPVCVCLSLSLSRSRSLSQVH